MAKLTKSIMHAWIFLASIIGFVFGWAVFAHSEKPAPLVVQQSAQVNVQAVSQTVSLDPVPSLDQLMSGGSQPVQVFRAPMFNAPILRARGS